MDTKKSLREKIRRLADVEVHLASDLRHANYQIQMIQTTAEQLVERLDLQGRETRDRALELAISSVTRLGAVDVVELARSYEAYLSGAEDREPSNKEMDFTHGLEEAGYSIYNIEDIARIAREAGVL